MRTNNPNTNPLYFQEYDEEYEHHEDLKLSETSETSEGDETFHDWYERKLRLNSNDPLRLHLFKESYRQILHYSIHMSTSGSPLTDYQMIRQCNALYTRFCYQCRI